MPTLFVLSTIVGAVRWFSPVPFWDMWEHTVRFYTDILDGRWSAFLDQANEHRILISYALFWLDYRFFGGLSFFLIAVNVCLMGALWLCLCIAARSLLAERRRLFVLCCALLAIPCFSWLQSENINWGFQSQFYLAYLLPLASLLCMASWLETPRAASRFVWAAIFAVLSAFTMANGLLAPPLLVVMLAVSDRCTWRRMLCLITIAIGTFAAYIYHYSAIPHQSAPLKRMAEFLLIFLGSPLGVISHSLPLAMLAGAAVIGACTFLAFQWMCGRVRHPFYLALLLFMAHVGAAGAAASLGRSSYGIDTALSSRYETPILLLYSAMFLLFVYVNRAKAATIPVVCAISILTPLLILKFQWDAIGPTGPEVARQKMQAALALNAGIDDREVIGRIYPQNDAIHVELIHQIAANAVQHDISIFALPSMQMAREWIGKPVSARELVPCLGSVDAVTPVASDPRHVRFHGWAFDAQTRQVPPMAFIAEDNRVIGAVLTGIERPDVRAQIDHKASNAGFEGYGSRIGTGRLAIYCPRRDGA
ncbi:hypothetical protein C7410_12967 [Paraburkholderia silvatlantica]|uniref:Glucosyltransferase GtrII-like protein n=2 Tax=Paraburkholderia silvatlantica TaxID=321895 RepID=A0A2V4T1H0_9BURK|nr:hypothetical protein C7410_12967 [Paraburkholderia silvatlantica]